MLSPSQYRPVAEEDPGDADDERSISELEDEQLQRRASYQRRHHGSAAPAFPGQDVRPTSVKELAGWYSYAWASEVYVVCGVGSFVPVTLEQLARENGVLWVDKVTRCVDVKEGAGMMGEKAATCVVKLFGYWVNTASYAMYTFSISVLIQSLIIISMSGAADHGNYRKRLLLAFAYMGSIATMMFITVTPNTYLFSAVWAIISNVGFGASFVLLNAFLPVLVRHHPSTNPQHAERRPSQTLDATLANGERSHLLSSPPQTPLSGAIEIPDASPSSAAIELKLSTTLSAYGIAIGYCAAVILQIFAICLLLYIGKSTWSLLVVMFCIGAWWFVFTIPTALWIRPRPGPPLPRLGRTATGERRERGIWSYISYSWLGLWKTVLRARRLRDVMLFLAAWFLVSDGVATVSGTAVLFAKTNLHMSNASVALISVISILFGIVGAFSWSRLSPLLNLSPTQTILACMALFEFIPLYGLLGYIPFIQKHGLGGLTQPWEMYFLGAVYGFVLGGIGGYCRSVFGALIPPGSEAAFYALYAVTDKGSSIFGPSIVGLLTDKYGDIRVAFWFLAVLLALPIPLIRLVDLERGKREGRALAEEELEGRTGTPESSRHGSEV